MVTRQQNFIIAKVKNSYRTLASIHKQYLDGTDVLQRCIRILSILSAARNRVPILQELRAASIRKSCSWTQSSEFQAFPFIATCLIIRTSYDPNAAYSERVRPMRFADTLEQVDNDEGITVIDISNPERLKHCFAFITNPIKSLDASTYLWRTVRKQGGKVDYRVEDDEWIETELKGQRNGEVLQLSKARLMDWHKKIRKRIRKNLVVKRLGDFDPISTASLQLWAGIGPERVERWEAEPDTDDYFLHDRDGDLSSEDSVAEVEKAVEGLLSQREMMILWRTLPGGNVKIRRRMKIVVEETTKTLTAMAMAMLKVTTKATMTVLSVMGEGESFRR